MHKNASDIFCLREVDMKKESCGQIFSVGGSPSLRIRRRDDLNSNVYPYGAPTNNKIEVKKLAANACNEDEIIEEEEEKPAPLILTGNDVVLKEEVSIPTSPGSAYTIKRNPLTGEGIDFDLPKPGKRRARGKKSNWVW